MKEKIILFILILFVFSQIFIVKGQANQQDSLILVEFYTSTNGPKWLNHSGWLEGPVNTWYGITLDSTGRVLYIDLMSDSISGFLPESLSKLSNLRGLALPNNQLSGNIPSSLHQLYWLEGLDLSYNNLSGKIPDSLGSAYGLISLFLQHNQLTGNIPSALNAPELHGLGNIDLSYNQLSGSNEYVPWDVQYLNLSHNKISGGVSKLSVMFYGRFKGYSALLDVSYNNLNFDGMEEVIPKVEHDQIDNFTYSPQAFIPLNYNNGILSVSAGGSLYRNTYFWYKNGTLDTIIHRDSTLKPSTSGSYLVRVNNEIATDLHLLSDILEVDVLPVSLINFNGNLVQGGVELTWQTTLEQNAKEFLIERSTDGINFSNVGKVNALGNSNQLVNYQYTDTSAVKLNTENLFYYLVMRDENGVEKQTKAIFLPLKYKDPEVSIFPNPARHILYLHFSGSFNVENCKAYLYDFSGKVVLQQKLTQALQQQIIIPEFLKGAYQLVIFQNQNKLTEKEIIIHP